MFVVGLSFASILMKCSDTQTRAPHTFNNNLKALATHYSILGEFSLQYYILFLPWSSVPRSTNHFNQRKHGMTSWNGFFKISKSPYLNQPPGCHTFCWSSRCCSGKRVVMCCSMLRVTSRYLVKTSHNPEDQIYHDIVCWIVETLPLHHLLRSGNCKLNQLMQLNRCWIVIFPTVHI